MAVMKEERSYSWITINLVTLDYYFSIAQTGDFVCLYSHKVVSQCLLLTEISVLSV